MSSGLNESTRAHELEKDSVEIRRPAQPHGAPGHGFLLFAGNAREQCAPHPNRGCTHEIERGV